jgi:hypothetical protein
MVCFLEHFYFEIETAMYTRLVYIDTVGHDHYIDTITKDNVTFYLPRPFHFLSYQSNRLLRRSDLHSKNF